MAIPTFTHADVGRIGIDAGGVRFAVTGTDCHGDPIGAHPSDTPDYVLLLAGSRPVGRPERPGFEAGAIVHRSWLDARITWIDPQWPVVE